MNTGQGKTACDIGISHLLNTHTSTVFVPGGGLEPPRPQWPQDFKSCVSTNSTIRALRMIYWKGKFSNLGIIYRHWMISEG